MATTSLALYLALKYAGKNIHIMSAIIEDSKATNTCIIGGSEYAKPIYAAANPPTYNCPSMPILKIPLLKAIHADTPETIIEVDCKNTPDI